MTDVGPGPLGIELSPDAYATLWVPVATRPSRSMRLWGGSAARVHHLLLGDPRESGRIPDRAIGDRQHRGHGQSGASPRARPRLLVYSMYDPGRPDRAGNVRSRLLTDALRREASVVLISGRRRERALNALRWWLREGPRSVDAVYVESASSFASPADLAFLLLLRVAQRPVGVYFRDAYQRFRDVYPVTTAKDRALDWLWRATTPLMMRLATHAFAPSVGLARVLVLPDVILLPPGTDPEAPDLGVGSRDIVGYVGAVGPPDGVDLLVGAMRIVRDVRPDARLLVVTAGDLEALVGPIPDWVEVVNKDRTDLPELLRDVAVCAIPRRINAYTDLAVPVKLMDYLSYGKPIVATECKAMTAILRPAGAAVLVRDVANDLADGILHILTRPEEARLLAGRARAFAVDPGHTWHARARTIISTLLPSAGTSRTQD